MADPDRNKLYQHIQIFGRDGLYIVRPDNDPASEQKFKAYPAALLWTIRLLAQAALDSYAPND